MATATLNRKVSMTHFRSRLVLATVFASLSLATVGHAQGGGTAPRPRNAQGAAGVMRRGGPSVGPDGGIGRQGIGARGNPAAMLLRLRTPLQLSDDQVKRLEALQQAPAPRTNEADMLRARADLVDATQGDGNIGKARAALDRLSGLRNERLVAGLRQRQEARAILTAEQKTRLDNMRGAMRKSLRARGMRGARRAGPAVGRGPFGPGQFNRGVPGGPRGGNRWARPGMPDRRPDGMTEGQPSPADRPDVPGTGTSGNR